MLSLWFIYYLDQTYFQKAEEAEDFLSMVPSRKGVW